VFKTVVKATNRGAKLNEKEKGWVGVLYKVPPRRREKELGGKKSLKMKTDCGGRKGQNKMEEKRTWELTFFG